MEKLILHPTDTCQWYALVNEAQASTKLILNEHTESYLVFLLMRYSQSSHLTESVIAMDYLESVNQPIPQQRDHLQAVGDKSLLFSGLFPGMAEKRHVSISYYINMGQAAYLAVSELQSNESAELYHQLSSQFIDMQQILQAMRQNPQPNDLLVTYLHLRQ